MDGAPSYVLGVVGTLPILGQPYPVRRRQIELRHMAHDGRPLYFVAFLNMDGDTMDGDDVQITAVTNSLMAALREAGDWMDWLQACPAVQAAIADYAAEHALRCWEPGGPGQ
jgi:hypothetical protein